MRHCDIGNDVSLFLLASSSIVGMSDYFWQSVGAICFFLLKVAAGYFVVSGTERCLLFGCEIDRKSRQ